MTRGYLGSTPDGGIDDADREPVPLASNQKTLRELLEWAFNVNENFDLMPDDWKTQAAAMLHSSPETGDDSKAKGLAVVRAGQLDIAAEHLDRNGILSLGIACRESAKLLRDFAIGAQKTSTEVPL